LLHVYSKGGGGKPYVFHEILDLLGKPSLAEHKIYKSQHYDLIKKKKKNSTSWDACNILNEACRSDGKPNIDCWNILQSSMVPEVNKGAGGQKLMDTMMILRKKLF
jgi:hypothetical protein